MIIDTHAHLYKEYYKDNLDLVINNAIASGIYKMICIGVDIKTSAESIKLSEKYNAIFASVGIHPHDSSNAESGYVKKIKDMALNEKVVAIGETGLDFYYNLSNKDVQIESFNQHLQIAKELNLPCIIHSRNADDEILSILKNHNYQKTVIHCFSGNKGFANKLAKLGTFISVTGLITFGGTQLEDAIKSFPIDRIMLETDSPYLSPIPKRGKQNQPKYIEYIASKLASIKNIPFDRLIKETSKNATAFFDI